MKLTETPNFKRGIDIIKKYECSPEIHDMGGNEWYVGSMIYWENIISKEEVAELELLGFHWYDESECLLFNGSSESIY